MKSISKKITVYIFVGFLVFCTTSTTYYRSVHAMEWVGGALAFEEAIKWLLAAMGIVSVGGATADYWENHGEDFLEYCEAQNISSAEVAEWQLKLCQGVLDKASSCWSAFKDWAYDIVSSSSGNTGSSGSITINGLYYGMSVSDFLNTFNNYYSTSFSYSGPVLYNVYAFILTSAGRLYIFVQEYNYNIKGAFNSVSQQVYLLYSSGSGNINYLQGYSSLGVSSQEINGLGLGPAPIIISSNISLDSVSTVPDSITFDTSSGGVSEFVSANDNIRNTDLLSSDTPDESNPEVSIPMPGINVGDDTISENAYDDFVDQVINDDRPIDEIIEDIQSLLRVIAYDTDTDDIIPNRPDPDNPDENVKKDDVINENKGNMGFTLAGLENVFPFCIPWDIYAFMTLLVADPVAPEFDFPIKSVNNQTEEIHVDLTPFEPVAVVVRYIFDFLFIIGLAMLTRSLIGGGSSD